MSIRENRGLVPDEIIPAFNGDRQRCCAIIGDEVLVKQSFKDECDVNLIVARYNSSGFLPGENGVIPRYEDVSDVPDYFTALEIVRRAGESFAGLHADVRAKFGNDPGRFVAFLDDPVNRDEAVKLGLLKAPEVPPVDLNTPGNVPLPK